MADYHASIRSNYFHVKATDEFEAWLSDLAYGEITAFSDATDGTVGFLGYCSVPSYDDDGEEIDFFGQLASHLSPGEIAIIFEIGSEKLRYLVGRATAVSHTGETTEIDLNDIYAQAQDEFLGSNPIQEAW